jgi:hypothetical protein
MSYLKSTALVGTGAFIMYTYFMTRKKTRAKESSAAPVTSSSIIAPFHHAIPVHNLEV